MFVRRRRPCHEGGTRGGRHTERATTGDWVRVGRSHDNIEARAVGVEVRDANDLGRPTHHRSAHRFEHTEATREGDLLVVAQVLVGKSERSRSPWARTLLPRTQACFGHEDDELSTVADVRALVRRIYEGGGRSAIPATSVTDRSLI